VRDRPALLEPWNVGPADEELSVALGIPANGTGTSHGHLASKSNGRRMLRGAGVDVPEGMEDITSPADVVAVIRRLVRLLPTRRRTTWSTRPGSADHRPTYAGACPKRLSITTAAPARASSSTFSTVSRSTAEWDTQRWPRTPNASLGWGARSSPPCPRTPSPRPAPARPRRPAPRTTTPSPDPGRTGRARAHWAGS
jgi:hypothetical protein